MSSVETLLLQAKTAGVTLSLEGNRIKARGTRAALDLMLEPLREHRRELLSVMTAPEPSADAGSWRELSAEYDEHYRHCVTCCAAGRGRGLRCGAGAALWAGYVTIDSNAGRATPTT